MRASRIKEAIEDLKNHDFGLVIEEYLNDYLSRHIKIDKENGISWILQPHLTNKIKTKFGEESMSMKGHETPGKPRIKIVRSKCENKIPIGILSCYRSGVGMLLYRIKHSRPDLENVVCELSK
jgi:hypothetical protein